MSVENADALTEYLKPEIVAGLANAHNEKKLVEYKKCGLAYIQACKDCATTNGVMDIPTLKEKILAAVNLLQAYHDALP